MCPRSLMVAALIFSSMLVPYARAASKYRVLYEFKGGADGYLPAAGLIFDIAGNLYGTTYEGGFENSGTVFELTPNGHGGWTETLIHLFSLNNGNGYAPLAGLILDSAGNLYGTTYWGGSGTCQTGNYVGCGTVFQLIPNGGGSWTENVLYSFRDNGTDGTGPVGSLIFDATGNLYGVTASGGTEGKGTVFMLTPNGDGSWKEDVLHSFNGTDGSFPDSSLIFDGSGNLYSTTVQGGASGAGCGGVGCGTVFQLTPGAGGKWTETVLHSFHDYDPKGSLPSAGLIFDPAGNIYGTTQLGGNSTCNRGYGCGVVFKLAPNLNENWTESVLRRFNGTDGSGLSSSLIFDQTGSLYGTAAQGGVYNFGTVFRLESAAKGAWKETVLHSFKDHPGAGSEGGLIFDGHGNLYGTAEGDGSKTFGTVFEITP
jgi:uncharacterized repeat protein (TIGR03803 family)